MDESKNNRAVEKKLKDCLKDDRARIQMGKISSFGLMEISRQRRRSGVLEGTTHICEHCAGVGRVRSVESSALAALRSIEMEAVRDGAGSITLKVPQAVGLYILNEKRVYLERVRLAQGLFVTIQIDDALSHADHEIERTETREFEPRPEDLAMLSGPLALPFDDSADDHIVDDDDEEDEEIIASDDEDDEDEDRAEAPARAAPRGNAERSEESGDDSEAGRRRRRRRRRGRRGDEPSDRAAPAEGDDEAREGDEDESADGSEPREGESAEAEAARRRRRRGRRGGRRMREDVRTEEPYGWTRPRAPDGDPYIWFDPLQPRQRPVQALETPAPIAAELAQEVAPLAEIVVSEEAPKPAKPARRRRPTKAELLAQAERVEIAEGSPVLADEPEPVAPTETQPVDQADIWVELPAVDEVKAKPARARRSRAKATPEAETQTEAVAVQTPIEAPLVIEPVAAVAEPTPVLEPEPVQVQVPEPEPTPDPAAIIAPPAQPKRGWWRR
jgi:ribonuclease E